MRRNRHSLYSVQIFRFLSSEGLRLGLLSPRRLPHQRGVEARSGLQLLDGDELVLGVGQGGVAGAEADGGDAGGVGGRQR